MAESEPENLFVVNSCFVKYLFLSKGLAAEIMVNVSQSKVLMNMLALVTLCYFVYFDTITDFIFNECHFNVAAADCIKCTGL